MASTLIHDVTEFLMDEESLEFEEEVKRDPYSVKAWIRYLDFRKDASHSVRSSIYERALKILPRSYKLWNQYLNECRLIARGKCITDPFYDQVVGKFEHAMVHMNKMPRMWLNFCSLLMDTKRITRTRHTFDRALCALPITQHHRIWKPYLKFIKQINVKETAVRVFRRYMMFDKSQREEYVDYLLSIGYHKEAGKQLVIIINDEKFHSQTGKTKHQFWMLLCDIVSKYPEEVSSSIKVEKIFRSGLRRFADEVGHLWCTLADYYIRLGQFECARDIFEEGIEVVVTVRDFSMIFDAYAKFEEELLTAKMSLMNDEDDEDDEEDDIEMRLARIEHLMDRRPLLLNSVLLRQNPHNVTEWLKRIKLFDADPAKAISTFAEAVKTVDPQKATGKPYILWVNFAKLYEKYQDLENARVIMQKAVMVNYRSVDDLAIVWSEWSEMEIRNDNFDDALALLRKSTEETLRSSNKKGATVQEKLYRSSKLWSSRIDLEESLGTFASTREAYDRAIELKVVTPQMILNYAAFLEENQYFEDSFTAFEKGIALFPFPHVSEIWHVYLDSFIKRYGGKKLERARDLFEQVVSNIPEKCAKLFYEKYAKLEEDYGLIRHAMSIYNRATKAVTEDERFEMYSTYIKKAEEFFGVTKTREIYENAIENLSQKQVPLMCLKFAEMERRLGEIDRSRALFVHASQYCDPRVNEGFWKKWHDFEVSHGNEDTFLDMLRIKRSVAVQYSQVNYTAGEMASDKPLAVQSESDAMAKLESKKAEENNSSSSTIPSKRKAIEEPLIETSTEEIERQSRKFQDAPSHQFVRKQEQEINPEEINLDDEMDVDVPVEEQPVPEAVFGKMLHSSRGTKETLGALERFKRG